MVRSGRRKRSTKNSTSIIGENSPLFDPKKRGNLSESDSATMANVERDKENPSLADVWKLFTEVKANTEKLVHDVEAVKESYNQLKTSLEFTESEVENLPGENKSLKLEVKDLKSQLLLSEKRHEELELRLFDLEDKKNDVEKYTRKFNLEIHGYLEQGDEEDNSINVMKLGHFWALNYQVRILTSPIE